jgi:hypothetical protein
VTEIDETNSLLSHEEWDVYSKLSEAWNLFIQLERLHSQDNVEFSFHINALKNIIMSRPVSRELVAQEINGYIQPEGEKGIDDTP